MLDLLKNRRIQYAAGAVATFVVTFAVTFSSSYKEVPPERPDRVVLNASLAGLPLTGDEATASGWADPLRCAAYSANRIRFNVSTREGRFLSKEGESYFLVYRASEANDALLAIYFFSDSEMPAPWLYEKDGLIGVLGLEFEHWGLPIFFRYHGQPCGQRSFAASGS